MPYLSQEVKVTDSKPVVDDLYPLLAVLLQYYSDVGRARVDGVVNEFFNAVGKTCDDLLCAELFCRLLRELLNNHGWLLDKT